MRKVLVLMLVALFCLTGCGATAAFSSAAMLPALAVYFGVWYVFWGVTIIGFIALSALLEEVEGSSGKFFFCFLLYLLFIQLSQRVDFIDFVKENTFSALLYALVYIVIGIIWSMFKIKLYASKKAEQFKKLKEKFMSKGKSEEDWMNYLNDDKKNYGEYSLCPTFENAKPRIIRWISYWPFSVFWFLLNDPIKRLFNAIYDLFKDVYRRIYEGTMSEAMSDVKKAKEKAKEDRESRRY